MATILGDMSKKFVYQVDPLYDTIKVVDHLQLSLDEREEYWFFEGMHSPGKPVDFPNGNGVIAHVGFFGHKLTLRILLPARKTVTLPVGNPATPKRVVAAEDLENGKCTVHGRLDSPLGKLLRGSIQVVTIESSNEWEIRVTTTNGKSATFKNSEVSLHRPGFGSIEDLNVLRKREQLADIDFYENASWSGVPKSLEGLLISQSYQEFACRSELVVCIP